MYRGTAERTKRERWKEKGKRTRRHGRRGQEEIVHMGADLAVNLGTNGHRSRDIHSGARDAGVHEGGTWEGSIIA